MTATIASRMVAGLSLALALGGCGGTARAPESAGLRDLVRWWDESVQPIDLETESDPHRPEAL